MLYTQVGWFIRLRWMAAAAALFGALANWLWLRWYDAVPQLVVLALFIVAYNILLSALLGRVQRAARPRRYLLKLAWIQILLDIACLTLLMSWTGGLYSPIAGFFVFHMVFASLLLPRSMAYASAGVAVFSIAGALRVLGYWPDGREEALMLAGRVATLLFTVYLTNHITRGLRRQRRRLIRQNRRIRGMDQQLRQQQQSMIQHEKMVAMGRMAAGVTHEIANPLASMDSLLQLMQRRPERMTPEQIATLRQQVERINQIIRQMKTFAHPVAAQQEVLPLNEVVEQALEMVRFDKRLGHVRIVRDYAPDAGSIPMLPQALQQVLINLIINALDAMSSSATPTLRIRTARRGSWRVVEVSDNGHGIKPELMRRLFEPFFTTKPVGQGTGLGLSISYSLVQKQGGSISAQSEEGVGTTFTIRLPGPASNDTSHPREALSSGVAASEKTTVS
jgi:signal transduction histidine kinase